MVFYNTVNCSLCAKVNNIAVCFNQKFVLSSCAVANAIHCILQTQVEQRARFTCTILDLQTYIGFTCF